MATSKAGKALANRRSFRTVDQWHRIQLLSKQTIIYHMGHTLTSMGIKLKPFPAISPPSSQSPPDSHPSNPYLFSSHQPSEQLTSRMSARVAEKLSRMPPHVRNLFLQQVTKLRPNNAEDNGDDNMPSTSFNPSPVAPINSIKTEIKTERDSNGTPQLTSQNSSSRNDASNSNNGINEDATTTTNEPVDDDDLEITLVKSPSEKKPTKPLATVDLT